MTNLTNAKNKNETEMNDIIFYAGDKDGGYGLDVKEIRKNSFEIECKDVKFQIRTKRNDSPELEIGIREYHVPSFEMSEFFSEFTHKTDAFNRKWYVSTLDHDYNRVTNIWNSIHNDWDHDVAKSYDNYPPAIHGEVNFTEKKLSRKNMLNALLETVGLSEAGWTNAEYKLEDGRRIDVVTETAEGFVSIEAMDSRGKCDDLHFDKGTNSYPMNLREEEGNCVAAIVVAAEFSETQIKRANEINNVGWMIALVTAEEVDGKTTFTLVN